MSLLKHIFSNNKDCCGCTACLNICPVNAIEMVIDEQGFSYPQINYNLCIDCNKCQKICPLQNQPTSINTEFTKPLVFAVKHKLDSIRMKSSSGGMFTALANKILNNNGVVYGAAYDKNIKNTYIRVDNELDLEKLRGSKYVQCEVGDIFKKLKNDLNAGKNVLFVGTPCYTAALINYIGNKKEHPNLLIVDIICHGVPSQKLFSEFISFCEKKNKSKIVNYYHCTKNLGWKHIETQVYENKKSDSNSALSQVWRSLFYSNNNLRPSCYDCKFTTTNRPSDITIGDFWGIEKSLPDFKDDKGVSLVLINTEKGNNFFDSIKGDIVSKQSSLENCMQPNLQHPTLDKGSENFWNDYNKYGFKYIAKKYGGYTIKRRIGKYVLEKTHLLNLIRKVRAK